MYMILCDVEGSNHSEPRHGYERRGFEDPSAL